MGLICGQIGHCPRQIYQLLFYLMIVAARPKECPHQSSRLLIGNLGDHYRQTQKTSCLLVGTILPSSYLTHCKPLSQVVLSSKFYFT
jgi:hypothetical protein